MWRELDISFDGKIITTTVANHEHTVNEWLRENFHRGREDLNPRIIGLHIEWRSPTSNSWRSNEAATLQLCVGKRCLIVELFKMDRVPEQLKSFFQSGLNTFVGDVAAGDVKKLRDVHGLSCANHFDIRRKAENVLPGKFRNPGLKDLALEVSRLGISNPSAARMSNWAVTELDWEEEEYGYIDAYAAYKIGKILKDTDTE